MRLVITANNCLKIAKSIDFIKGLKTIFPSIFTQKMLLLGANFDYEISRK